MQAMPPAARLLSALVCWLVFQLADRSRGDDKLVVPVHGAPFTAELMSITADWQLLFADGDDIRKVAVDDLVYWGAYRDQAERSQILLRDGSQLVAEVTSISAGVMQINSAIMRRQEIPLEAVLGINFLPKLDNADRSRQIQQIRNAGKRDGQVWLANGDQLAGILTGLENPAADVDDSESGMIAEVVTENQVVRLPIESIAAVRFAGSTGTFPDSKCRAMVGCADGSLLQVVAMKIDEDAIEVQTVSGVALQMTNGFAPPLAAVTFIQSETAKVVYLSDLKPVRTSDVPMLGEKFELQADRNATGAPLRWRGTTCLKGLGMHGSSNVVYTIDEKHSRFATEVAIDASSGNGGSVIFRVFLLGADNQWAPSYTSAIIRGGHAPVPVSVELGQAKAIALAVDQSERGDVLDRANWLNARFEK